MTNGSEARGLRALAGKFRPGLRARVIVAFSIGALLLAAALSTLVIGVTRTNLINEREAQAARRVYSNATIIRSNLTPDGDPQSVLASLQTPEGSRPLVYELSRADPADPTAGWSSVDPAFGRSVLPASLREVVLAGAPAKMRFNLPDGTKALVIGTPIEGLGAYFEFTSLTTIDDILSSISYILFGGSIITVLAGAAFGLYSSRRILRPLGAVGDAAQLLASGDLDARIETLVDPDLEPIITSFNGMAETLETRIEKDTQFASDVSHELRSPLMTLQASVEVLENNREDLPERAQAALTLLADDLDRFRELVEDLLEISRFDAGVMQLDLEEVLLRHFVGHAITVTGFSVPVMLAPGVELDPELDDIVVALDKRRIARAIANLLTNADKYAEGGPATVVIDADDDSVRIMVDDEGEGVPEEDRRRIFERFNRAGAAHRRGQGTGVGLGLALVDEHVRLHGGTASVVDSESGGARFIIELPRTTLEHLDEEPPIDTEGLTT